MSKKDRKKPKFPIQQFKVKDPKEVYEILAEHLESGRQIAITHDHINGGWAISVSGE